MSGTPTPRVGFRVGFLGPFATFTEQAVRSQPDLAGGELIAYASVPEVLDAVADGSITCGVVPIENSIEGVVNFTQDALAFDYDLAIMREIVLDIELCLMARPGTTLADVKVLHSIPVATAQCHRYVRSALPGVEIRPASSTAAAARLAAEGDVANGIAPEPGAAAIAPRVAAQRYGLELLAADIADHQGNQTRFVLVGAGAELPRRTGRDRTAMVVYQRADVPGSLLSILQEFAARRINLSNLVSRPTKDGGLGDNCFVIYADGHIDDDLLADALRALHAKQGGVKFLGSYPVADAARHHAEVDHDAAWLTADDWVDSLRNRTRI